MDVLSFGLAALVGTVILIALMDALSSRLSIPFAVLAAVFGMASGLACLLSGWSPLDLALDDYDAWFLSSLALTPQSVIYVFLPALLFEMTLSVDIRNLRQDMEVVAVMAVVAVVAATVAVGGLLSLVTGLPLVASLLLGAVVSTTDPAAVVSTFRRVGAPRRLLMLLKGETLSTTRLPSPCLHCSSKSFDMAARWRRSKPWPAFFIFLSWVHSPVWPLRCRGHGCFDICVTTFWHRLRSRSASPM